jgi:hypothetical protein
MVNGGLPSATGWTHTEFGLNGLSSTEYSLPVNAEHILIARGSTDDAESSRGSPLPRRHGQAPRCLVGRSLAPDDIGDTHAVEGSDSRPKPTDSDFFGTFVVTANTT